MIRYLLADLPASQTEELDELSVTDDRFVERLRSVEEDLVDSYARGALSGDNLKRFQEHYLASPMRREKVRFAQAFLSYTDAVGPGRTPRGVPAQSPTMASPPKSGSRGPSWFSFITRPAWLFATAAVLLVLVGTFLVVENQRLRNRMAQTQAERATLEQQERELQQQLAEQSASDAETEKELARVRERLAQLEQTTAGQATKPDGRGRELPLVAFTLAPPTRGGGAIRTLTIPAGAGVVAFKLELESDDFPRYQANLKDPATGQVIWRGAELRAAPKGRGKTISLRLRADLLKPRMYIFELAGSQEGATPEIIGTYPFKVAIE
jgi:hypothetical protein